MTTDDQALSEILQALLEGSRARQCEAFEELAHDLTLQRGIECVAEGEPSSFWYAVLSPVHDVVQGLLATQGVNRPELVFIYEAYDFVERHFRQVFQAYEGPACCTDKARTVVRRLVRFYAAGEEVSFAAETVTYHHPKRVLRTHESAVAFLEGLHHLYYGRPERYLRALEAIALTAPADSD